MSGSDAGLNHVLSSASIALAGAIMVVLFALAIDHVRTHRRFQRRLARFDILGGAAGPAGPSPAAPGADLIGHLGRRLARRQTRERLRELHERCERAGLEDRLGVEELLGLRVVGALTGVALGSGFAVLDGIVLVGLSAGTVVVWALVGAVLGGLLGYLIPDVAIRQIAARRRVRIGRQLPNAVDILAVSLEAGLGFDTAVEILCERTDNDLARELGRYLADLRLGRSRREALTTMVARADAPGMADFAAAVIQADELGTGLVRALRGQSMALRTARRLRAEELAREAPIKLMFPMVIFILPVLFLVTIGPALLRAVAAFGRG